MKTARLSLGLLMVLAISLQMASANLGTFPQNTCVNILIPTNASGLTLSSLAYPNSSVFVTGGVFTQAGFSFNYTSCNTNTLGTYHIIYNDSNKVYGSETYTIGTSLDTPTSLLFSLIFIGLLFLIVFSFTKVSSQADYGWKVGYILLAYVTSLVTAFLSYYVVNTYLPALPLLAAILNLLWIILAIGLFIVLILLGFSLIREQVREADSQKKKKFGRED